MEEIKPVEYIGKLEQGIYYYVQVSEEKQINFLYDKETNKEKPFLLDNKLRINHVPTYTDLRIFNLNPISVGDYTAEERHKIAQKGGTNSQKNQLQRKTFKESLETFLSLKASKNQLTYIDKAIIDELPKDIRDNLTQEDLITLKALELAQNGSNNHAIYVRDTIGEKPTDKHDISAEVITEGDRALIDKLSKRLAQDQE